MSLYIYICIYIGKEPARKSSQKDFALDSGLSLKRFSLSVIYVSMNFADYAFDINSRTLLEIEFAVWPSGRLAVWPSGSLAVCQSVSQPFRSCRRHLARNFYSPLGLIWSRSSDATICEYLLCSFWLLYFYFVLLSHFVVIFLIFIRFS